MKTSLSFCSLHSKPFMNICSMSQAASIVSNLVLYFYVCSTSHNHLKLSRLKILFVVLKLVAFHLKYVAACGDKVMKWTPLMLTDFSKKWCSTNFRTWTPVRLSCLSGCVNRAQQACSQFSVLFIYPEGTVLIQPLHPMLLNSSAMASTVEPQTLISCWGV